MLRRYFLTHDTQQSKRQNAKNGLHIVARNRVHSHASLNENSVSVMASFLQKNCLILQTINYRGPRYMFCSSSSVMMGLSGTQYIFFASYTARSTIHERPNSFISFMIIILIMTLVFPYLPLCSYMNENET